MTDPKRTPDPVSIVKGLPHGVGVIFRHFGLDNRFELGKKLREITSGHGVLLFLSADDALAEEIKPDGIHWPKHLLEQYIDQKHRPLAKFHTTSAHVLPEIKRAENFGMDACFVSSLFPSQSPSAPEPMGVTRFNSLSKSSNIPLYALGGINAKNVGQLPKTAGFSGIDLFGI